VSALAPQQLLVGPQQLPSVAQSDLSPASARFAASPYFTCTNSFSDSAFMVASFNKIY
jgi:hypothetical protein